MNFQQFKDKWKEFNKSGYGYLKLPIDHPLEFQVGYCGSAKKALIVMDIGKHNDIPCSNAIKAENRELANGTWSLELQLVQEEYEEEFLCLGWDIISCSKSSNAPIETLIKRYLSWQKLLQYANKEVLSFSRQKGLVGELLFLEDCMKVMDPEIAIESWTGPDGSDQDFVFVNTWNEIKAVSLAADTVKISSFEQLNQEMDGTLTIYILEKTTPGNDRVVLSYLVENIRTLLGDNSQLLDVFNMKIFKYGYRNKDENEYEKNQFRFIERIDYIVDSTFPKLTKQNISPEIISGEYSLSLAAIDKYRRG